MQYQIEGCKLLILKSIWDLLENILKKNRCSLIKILCMKNCVTKLQHLKTINWTVILIFPRYCTHLLIFCDIHPKGWWYGAKYTENWRVDQKDLWFRTARLVWRNNDCVMCFCILWCKNFMRWNKIISKIMNLWF